MKQIRRLFLASITLASGIFAYQIQNFGSLASQKLFGSLVIPQGGQESTIPGSGRGGRGAGGARGGGGRRDSQSVRSDYPQWVIEPAFVKDVFTFVRVEFRSGSQGFGGGFGRGGGWRNDYPDCDWNFSSRLQQLTTFKVDPNGKTLKLTEPELFDFPFIFMTNMGDINLDAAEQQALRKYLLHGGFMMADDFWAAREWQHIREEMRQVFPDREPVELSLDHEIFHVVYDLVKLPQVPSILAWQRGMTYEDWHGAFDNGDTSPHFWGYFDDDKRLVGLFCHNNDVADGWEREGEDIEYFQEYSLKCSYPFGVNIITYAMTH